MSHVTHLDTEGFNSLEDIHAACRHYGLKLTNKKTYTWFGRYVGDYPLPEGLLPRDLGKCHYCIQVPGATYEIGVVRLKGKYFLLFDFWNGGYGLEEKLGKRCHKLTERINLEAAIRAAKKMGCRYTVQTDKKGKQILCIHGKRQGTSTELMFEGTKVKMEGKGFIGPECTVVADQIGEMLHGEVQRTLKREHSLRRRAGVIKRRAEVRR